MEPIEKKEAESEEDLKSGSYVYHKVKKGKILDWGCKHVISPELFFEIFVKPGASLSWTRTYALRFF